MRGLRGLGIRGMADPVFSAGCPGRGLMSTILSYDPIAYWPLNELAGLTAINYGSLGAAANGTYTGVTLNQIDAPGGTRAGLWDGLNDIMIAPNAVVSAAINYQTFTILGFHRVYNVGVLTDGAFRKSFLLRQDDANNFAYRKNAANNQHEARYTYGGGIAISWDDLNMSTDWTFFAATIDVPSDALKDYLDGIQWGLTQTGFSAFASLANVHIGADDIMAAQTWYGYLSHFAICNSVLTQTQLMAIYTSGLPF